MFASTLTMVLMAGFTTAAAALMLAVVAAERAGLSARQTSGAAVAAALLNLGAMAAALAAVGKPAMIFAVFSNVGSPLFRELTGCMLAVVSALVYIGAVNRRAYVETCQWTSSVAALAALAAVLGVGSSFVMPWKAAWASHALVAPMVALAMLEAALLWRLWARCAAKGKLDDTRLSVALAVLFLAMTLLMYLTRLDATHLALVLGGRLMPALLILAFAAALAAASAFSPRRSVMATAVAISAPTLFIYPWMLAALGELADAWHFFAP